MNQSDNYYDPPRSQNVRTRMAEGEEVVLTDIDIPFGRCILIILKWSFAAIPAMIIMWLIMAMIMAVVVAIFGQAMVPG